MSRVAGSPGPMTETRPQTDDNELVVEFGAAGNRHPLVFMCLF